MLRSGRSLELLDDFDGFAFDLDALDGLPLLVDLAEVLDGVVLALFELNQFLVRVTGFFQYLVQHLHLFVDRLDLVGLHRDVIRNNVVILFFILDVPFSVREGYLPVFSIKHGCDFLLDGKHLQFVSQIEVEELVLLLNQPILEVSVIGLVDEAFFPARGHYLVVGKMLDAWWFTLVRLQRTHAQLPLRLIISTPSLLALRYRLDRLQTNALREISLGSMVFEHLGFLDVQTGVLNGQFWFIDILHVAVQMVECGLLQWSLNLAVVLGRMVLLNEFVILFRELGSTDDISERQFSLGVDERGSDDAALALDAAAGHKPCHDVLAHF